MSVGNISSADNPSTTFGLAMTLHKLAPGSITAPDITVDAGRTVPTAWAFGTSTGQFNQMLDFIFTATKNTTTQLDLSGASGQTNRIGDLLATLTLVRYMRIEYLTVAQDAVNGTASTGTITFGPGSSAITTGPWGTAQTQIINPGAVWMWQDPLNGFTVTDTSADKLAFVHSDTSADAHLRITILGLK